MKVLLVEDDDAVAHTTTRTLRRAGYDVVRAADAMEAIATARREAPDVVVLDLGLPAGGGGVVLRRLRALAVTSLTPVVVVTGGASLDQMLALQAEGVDHVLQKPAAEQALLDAIADVLGDDA